MECQISPSDFRLLLSALLLTVTFSMAQCVRLQLKIFLLPIRINLLIFFVHLFFYSRRFECVVPYICSSPFLRQFPPPFTGFKKHLPFRRTPLKIIFLKTEIFLLRRQDYAEENNFYTADYLFFNCSPE